MRFQQFLEKTEEIEDIKKLLEKIPQSHADLVRGYTWKLQQGNTLNNDDEHVGYIDHMKKEIVIAAPWRYSRDFTVLHEIAHQVWSHLDPKLKKEWESIVAKTKHKQNQNAEELFCMGYGATYCAHAPTIHYHKNWESFIKRLPK